MVEAALTTLTGTILYVGAHHLYLGTMRTSTQPHLQLAAMYLLLAGFVLASALMYQSQEISAQVQLARLSMTINILLWVALIWYVAFYTRSKPLLLLDFLTAVWVIFLVRNISSPHGLLSADIAPIALSASAGSWWTAVKFTMLASLLFCFYASLRMFRRGNKQAALALVFGLSILVAASLADHLLNTRVNHTLYLAPFGFIGFLLANSLYPILLNYQKRRKAIRAPVIYSLTFSPEWTSFDSRLSDLQSPPGEKLEVAVTQAPESTVATFLPEGPLEGEAVDVAVIEPGTKTGSSETGEQTPWQEPPMPMPQRCQSSLNTVSDNLIDIAVYATMALNRFKRGDADPQVLEMLCKKIRTKAIKTRRMANKLSRPGKPGDDNEYGS
ncbi:MAG: hypothetical protein U9Q19_09495 [Pseudomonadota bacterium]|nr:hypothetical protein [Pseudomonadota bacterium]